MKTILYGNDIHLEWGFTDAVTGLNFDFAGVDIKLTLFSCNKVFPVDNYTQEGGTINAIIPTKCMPCGIYTAECEYSVGMGVKRAKVRINDAFQISNNKPWHPEEGITPCEMHEMETVYLHSIAMPIITSKIAMIEYLSGNRYNELKENDCLKKRTIYVVEKEGEKADMYLYKYPLSSGSIPGTIDWDDIQNKPDIPEPYVLPIAKENELGGIKASPKTENETTEVKIGEDGKLYAPEISKIRMATENELGGIKASPKTDCDTVEIKIGEDGKLYGKKGVGGNPDNEDLCLSTNSDGEKVLKFNNKSYDASSFSGLGRVYLRKNIVSDKNKLSQDMINSPNTIYIIQYDYDLAGGTINIPSNCILDFQGGSIKNGKIVGDNTSIKASTKIFDSSISIKGTFINGNTICPLWFGANPDRTFDNSYILSYIFSMIPNNFTVDFLGETYYIYGDYEGNTENNFPINRVPYLLNKEHITIKNGCIDIPEHKIASSKCKYPSTLAIDGCNHVTIQNMNILSKGEEYGDSDGSQGLGFEARREFIAKGGGHPIVIIRSQNINIINCRFEYAGSVGSFYSSSSTNVILNNVFSSPYSLGYAAYAVDGWTGTTTQTGWREHLVTLTDCHTNKGVYDYGCKGCIVIEDVGTVVQVTGGVFEDAYPNGGAHFMGNAFVCGSESFLLVNGAYVNECASVGHAGGSNSRLEIRNVKARNLRTSVHIQPNTVINSGSYIKYENCDFEILSGDKSKIWESDSGYLDRTTVITNPVGSAWVHLSMINCNSKGADTFALNRSGCYGMLKVSGGTHEVASRILDSKGWGGVDPNLDFFLGILFSGVRFKITGTPVTTSYSTKNEAAICLRNENEGIFTTFNLDIDSKCLIIMPYNYNKVINNFEYAGDGSTLVNKRIYSKVKYGFITDSWGEDGVVRTFNVLDRTAQETNWLLTLNCGDRAISKDANYTLIKGTVIKPVLSLSGDPFIEDGKLKQKLYIQAPNDYQGIDIGNNVALIMT